MVKLRRLKMKFTTIKEATLMKGLSHIWFNIQTHLFPHIEEEIAPLTDRQKQLVATLELIRIEKYVHVPDYWRGQSPKDRIKIARAFVAKAVYNMNTTRELIERLKTDVSLLRICGWEKAKDIPHESSFSRSYASFSKADLGKVVHEALIKQKVGEKIVGHISRDSTAINGREKPVKKTGNSNKPKERPRKRGRPKKGKERIKEPTRLERQQKMTGEEMIAELPDDCDVGTKKNSKGKKESWIGYKLHIDAADGQIPVSCILTSASVHDSQVALPLAEITQDRVTNLYDLMDSAYDSPIIHEHSRELGHVPIIDTNPRRNKELKMQLEAESKAQKLLNITSPELQRYKERSNVERVNSRLKDEFGGRKVRVRGAKKVYTHLMFGILALTADQLFRFIT